MELRYLSREEKALSRRLYEEVFVEDEAAFVDAYYRIKAADNQILAAVEEGHIRSMLHRNPYTFRLRGESVRADYLVAVATELPFRHQGLMRSLLTRALMDMREERRPFAFLMPADEAIYLPFDFRLMGNEDEEGLADLEEAKLKETYDLYIEKDGDYERRHISWPEWETTPMMMRLLHLPAFLAAGTSAGLCGAYRSGGRAKSDCRDHGFHSCGKSGHFPLGFHLGWQLPSSGSGRAGGFRCHCGYGKLSLRYAGSRGAAGGGEGEGQRRASAQAEPDSGFRGNLYQ